MSGNPVPQIFSTSRRVAVRARAAGIRERVGETPFLFEHMAEEVLDRLAFVRHQAKTALHIGPTDAALIDGLGADGAIIEAEQALDLEAPFPHGGYDLIVAIAALETLNDLPGALVHLNRALAPGGLGIATMIGAPSLAHLRRAMLAADGERPAARMHPLVDVRAAAELVQRAGWHSPVVDSHSLRVSYGSLDRLIADLRLHGLTSVLRTRTPPLTRSGMDRAREAFLENADQDGKIIERFEILTLSGWRK